MSDELSETQSFRLWEPVYMPCYNRWGEDVYRTDGSFDFDPVDVPATSTSGSPVLLTGDLFVGVLDPLPGGRFRSDGQTLQVVPPPGGRLFVRQGQDPRKSWQAYNTAVLAQTSTDVATEASGFFDAVEYCTWVEQKSDAAAAENLPPAEALTEKLVLDYLGRLDALGFPPGKFTIDLGWSPRSGPGGFGDWDAHQDRFPNLARVVDAITDAGHIPGLWFAPGRVDTGSRLFGNSWVRTTATGGHPLEEGVHAEPDERYLLPTEELADHYREVFARYVAMGVRKFKLDLHYGPKLLMRDQLAQCYQAIKAADPGAEVEHHIPDIFVSRYADVVRTNDVLITADRDWRGLTRAHWDVCARSSPDRILNLDHVGGNNPHVAEADFLAHWAMFTEQPGHPVISLLPDRFSPRAVEVLRNGLWTYEQQRATRIEDRR